MTRIIAGRAGGTTLEVPDRGTRPTSDRVRESLFGALESAGAIEGARVAVSTVLEHLDATTGIELVRFVLFSDETHALFERAVTDRPSG